MRKKPKIELNCTKKRAGRSFFPAFIKKGGKSTAAVGSAPAREQRGTLWGREETAKSSLCQGVGEMDGRQPGRKARKGAASRKGT